MNRDTRVLITNLACLAATAGTILGLYAMGAGIVCAVGAIPMFGFTWVSDKP